MSLSLQSGRLLKTRPDVVRFTSSAKDDEALAKHIVSVNQAHIVMLAKRGIINAGDSRKILRALRRIRYDPNRLEQLEDFHVYVEDEVTRIIGPKIAGNINLAKSRNDQVATAIRMALRESLLSFAEKLCDLRRSLLKTAKKHVRTIFPAYSHNQPAQPITYAHFLLAHHDGLQRDLERVLQCYRRVNRSPMGAGAAAGTSFPIDRRMTANLLGFDGLIENTLDAVGARDFLQETLASYASVAVHLSRLAQDLIYLGSQDVGILDLPEEYTSTSSIMPQKKNPDALELIRAHAATVCARLVACAEILRTAPSGYSLDFQELTPLIWQNERVVSDSSEILAGMMPKVRLNRDIPSRIEKSFTTSTELANMLVKDYRIPFRLAHKIVGTLVRKLLREDRSLAQLKKRELEAVSRQVTGRPALISQSKIEKAVDPQSFVERHRSIGGPSPTQVSRMISRRESAIRRERQTILGLKANLESSSRRLMKIVSSPN